VYRVAIWHNVIYIVGRGQPSLGVRVTVHLFWFLHLDESHQQRYHPCSHQRHTVGICNRERLLVDYTGHLLGRHYRFTDSAA